MIKIRNLKVFPSHEDCMSCFAEEGAKHRTSRGSVSKSLVLAWKNRLSDWEKISWHYNGTWQSSHRPFEEHLFIHLFLYWTSIYLPSFSHRYSKMDRNLKCNVFGCDTELKDEAFVTTCR